MYKIVASYKGGEFEEVDTAETLSLARTLLAEYRMAFTSDFSVIFYNTKD